MGITRHCRNQGLWELDAKYGHWGHRAIESRHCGHLSTRHPAHLIAGRGTGHRRVVQGTPSYCCLSHCIECGSITHLQFLTTPVDIRQEHAQTHKQTEFALTGSKRSCQRQGISSVPDKFFSSIASFSASTPTKIVSTSTLLATTASLSSKASGNILGVGH